MRNSEEKPTHKVRTPLFPTYADVRSLMHTVAESRATRDEVRRLIYSILDQTGTPQ